MLHMTYVIEGEGALVNEAGEETPLKAGDFALVNPNEKHQYRNKGAGPFKMICECRKSLNDLILLFTRHVSHVTFSAGCRRILSEYIDGSEQTHLPSDSFSALFPDVGIEFISIVSVLILGIPFLAISIVFL